MYGKIFESIFDSSLSSEGGFVATYVMMAMVVLADEHGFVDISYEALYDRLKFPDDFVCKQEFNRALNILEAPDPHSNLPNMEGRRIIPLSEIDEIEENRGWLIVNYLHYREKGNKHDSDNSRREYMQKYMAKRRAKEKENKKKQGNSNGVNNGKQPLTGVSENPPYTDTDTDTDTDKDKEDHCASATHFDCFWKAYPRKTNKKQAREIWKRKKLDSRVDLLLEAVRRHCQSEQWQTPSLIPHPSTWLRNERWEDELSENATAGGPL